MKYQMAAALVLVAVIGMVNARVESGMNDDWSFIHTARDLAATGQLRYNGWSAPLIGFQAYWAAFFIKIFGFSFLAARASVWVLAVLSIPILWRLFLAVELSEAQAFFGLMLFLLSPLVFPNLTTFMTDLPAFFLFAAALLCALKAWDSREDSKAMLWAGAATCCAMLSGSVRQFYWLAGVCFLVVLGLARFRSARGRVGIGLCIGAIVSFAASALAWLAHQPYVPVDQTIDVWRQMSWKEIGAASGLEMARALVGLAVLSLPATLLLAWSGVGRIPIWMKAVILGSSVAIPFWLADPMPWLGNTITNFGVTISENLSVGEKPVVLSDNLMLALAALGLAAAFCAFGRTRGLTEGGLGRFAALTVPFLFLYTIVLDIRAPSFGLYDRYFIPHLFVILVLALGVYARRNWSLNWAALAPGGMFAIYALATTHDYFAEARAKWRGAEEVVGAGYPRTAVIAGFEYDLWTQAEVSGHVNNPLVRFPAGAFQQMEDCNGPDDTLAWWRSFAPDLRARYVVTLTPIAELRKSEFANVEYRRWLPLGTYRVYVENVAAREPALTCKPDTATQRNAEQAALRDKRDQFRIYGSEF